MLTFSTYTIIRWPVPVNFPSIPQYFHAISIHFSYYFQLPQNFHTISKLFLYYIQIPSHLHVISMLFPTSVLFPIQLPSYFHPICAQKRFRDGRCGFLCVAEGKLSAEQAKGLMEKGKELGVLKSVNGPDVHQPAQV